MCSTKENNAAQQITSSVWSSCIINMAEDIQYRFVSISAQPRMCSMQISVQLSHIISVTGDTQYG